MQTFTKLCTPSKIYFSIAIIASIIALLGGVSFMIVFIKLVFAFIWTFALGWLCNKGYTSISWVLVLLPYIIILLAIFKIYHVADSIKQLMRTIKLQGAYGQEAMSHINKKN